MDLIKKLQIEDLPPEQATLAELIGFDVYKVLVQNYAGTGFYIPTQESLLVRVRDRMIKADYEAGVSYRELALRYGISQAWTRKIVQSDQPLSYANQIGLDSISPN